MSKSSKSELVSCQYFTWRLARRNDVYYGDGRANQPDVGRHSLGTKSREEAICRLKLLDQKMAVSVGVADPSILFKSGNEGLPVQDGVKAYLKHCQTSNGLGVAKKTLQRYVAVFDKLLPFLQDRGIPIWQQVTKRVVEDYLADLAAKDYAYATMYLELTTIQQIIKWMVQEKMLSADHTIRLKWGKSKDTSTYCWRPEEYSAIIAHCRSNAKLHWLWCILTGLGTTGLRISELASLRRSDLDFDRNVILLTDERRRRRQEGREGRRLKSGRDRSLPIHPELREVLDSLPINPDGLVFHGPKGAKVKPDTVRNVLIRDVLMPLKERFPTPRGEVGFESGRLHSFRHYFCSTAASSGAISEQVVKAWLGHRDSDMVRRYFHLMDATAQQHMKSLRFDVGPTDEGRS